MNKLTSLALTLAACAIATAAWADDARVSLSAEAIAAHAAGPALLQEARAHAHRIAKPDTSGSVQPKVMGTSTYPGTPMANAFRGYPPSCAADPLPDHASGPTYSARVPLYSLSSSGAYAENVTITVWRLACSSGGSVTPYNSTGEFYNAMTLVRIDRDTEDSSTYPTMPFFSAQQGSNEFGTLASVVRIAAEPNTVVSEVYYGTPMYSSTTYVLESYPYTGYGYFSFADAFTLRVDPGLSGVDPVDISVPAYNPTSSAYPDAYNPLYLDGYAAAQWTNSTRNHGLLVQITEQPQSDGSTQRQLVYDLLTEDQNGDPLWLVGSKVFQPFTTSVTVDASYLVNGLGGQPWGKATFEVTDCNHLSVTYVPNANLPAPITSFSGKIVYDRLFSANGMLCE